MDSFIESVSEFIGSIVAVTIVSGGFLLFAGEIRLAALKKASHRSTHLSAFTAKMTKMKLSSASGGQHGTGKESH